VKAFPFLFFPFLFLFTETYLHLERLSGDYQRIRLNQQMKQLEEEIRALDALRAELEGRDRINAAAEGYGLVEPEPNQIEVLRIQHVPIARESNYDLAKANAENELSRTAN